MVLKTMYEYIANVILTTTFEFSQNRLLGVRERVQNDACCVSVEMSCL